LRVVDSDLTRGMDGALEDTVAEEDVDADVRLGVF
jgi:hypothetical protein